MMADLRKLTNAVTNLKRLFTGLLRVGVVTQVNGETARVRVSLPGLEDMQSGWLPCLTWRTYGVRASFNYKVGERVLCLFVPISDMSSGFVLGSFYDDKQKPPQSNIDVFSIEFEDGTVLAYDQSTSTGSLKIKGGLPSLTATPDKVEIESPLISLIGPTQITGTLSVSDATDLMSTLHVVGQTTLDNILNGAMSATFMGSVGAAGYTGPVSGGVAKMTNGAEVSSTLTYKGEEVTTMPHTHIGNEGKPTGPAEQ